MMNSGTVLGVPYILGISLHIKANGVNESFDKVKDDIDIHVSLVLLDC